MKNILLNILNDYLVLFPQEEDRQAIFMDYLLHHNDEEVVDWNNFDGHVVASGFVYAKKDKKFLVLYHNDMKIFVYPGGHMDMDDKNPLEAAKREVFEETGIKELLEIKVSQNELVPMDISTHMVVYNERLNLPEHYHFDFRYLFVINKVTDIKIDQEESSSYKWIDIGELESNKHYGKILQKIKRFYPDR